MRHDLFHVPIQSGHIRGKANSDIVADSEKSGTLMKKQKELRGSAIFQFHFIQLFLNKQIPLQVD